MQSMLGEQIGLLVADVPWDVLHAALSATGDGVAARGDRLLRYVAEGMDDVHAEGDLLDRETDEVTIASSQGFDAVLTALGFEAEAWLAEGAKWEVTWTSLDMEQEPEAVKRLYRGPVRRRAMWVEESALDEMGWRPDAWPESGAVRPSGGPSDG